VGRVVEDEILEISFEQESDSKKKKRMVEPHHFHENN
jgi:hypothetical protein